MNVIMNRDINLVRNRIGVGFASAAVLAVCAGCATERNHVGHSDAGSVGHGVVAVHSDAGSAGHGVVAVHSDAGSAGHGVVAVHSDAGSVGHGVAGVSRGTGGLAEQPSDAVELTDHRTEQPAERRQAEFESAVPPAPHPVPEAEGTLFEFLDLAQQANPRLRRLEQETAAAWARVPQVRALPDPMVGGNVFGRPMRMAIDDRLVGGFMVSQTLPWLKRLDAQGQQAAYDALVLQQELNAERLRVAADVRAGWARLYLLGRQERVSRANQALVEMLIEIANARVGAGAATQGDVLLGMLEYSRIEEDLVGLEQQTESAKAAFNRLLNRPADAAVPIPEELEIDGREWTFNELRELAAEYQPEIVAAQLRTQATAWGLRVASLRQVPDLTLSYERMFMDMGRGGDAGTMSRRSGGDPWQVGLTMNVPLWRKKYEAIETEAAYRHAAAHRSVEEAVRENDALLMELWQQARAARTTAALYVQTILPQSRQTLEADQEAYAQDQVEFDRVIADVRNLLTLEIAYHRALAELATAQARLEQTTGTPLGWAEPASDRGEELR